MVLSSRLSECGWCCGVGAFVAEQGPRDVDGAGGEGDECLGVGSSVVAFFEVVVAVGSVARHAGLGGQVEHVPQWPAVAAGLVQVARSSAGVVGYGDEP